MAEEKDHKNEGEITPVEESPTIECGIIMPIADNPNLGYPLGHWGDVLSIIEDAFKGTEYTPNLVSKKDSVGLIHESIVTNIYSNEIVICDVSTRNPNVMFELGMRLAFDKPVIIIKDEKTDYSFDTGPIEHINYPSSLRFQAIVKFKEDLLNRARYTHKAAKNPGFSPYLKSFNKAIVPAKIENVEIKDLQFLVDSVQDISSNLDALTRVVSNMRVDIKEPQNSGAKLNASKGTALELENMRSGLADIASTIDWGNITDEQGYTQLFRKMPKRYSDTLGDDLVKVVVEVVEKVKKAKSQD